MQVVCNVLLFLLVNKPQSLGTLNDKLQLGGGEWNQGRQGKCPNRRQASGFYRKRDGPWRIAS